MDMPQKRSKRCRVKTEWERGNRHGWWRCLRTDHHPHRPFTLERLFTGINNKGRDVSNWSSVGDFESPESAMDYLENLR